MLRRSVFGFLILFFLFGRAGWSAQGTAQERSFSQLDVEIDRIDVLGVKVFPNQAIEGVLEIAPGDHLERVKIVRTEENLQALYLSHGYEQMSVRTKLVRKRDKNKNLETVLEFEIIEGRPVRVSHVDLLLDGNRDERVQNLWNSKRKKMATAIPLSPTDVLNQDKIAEGKRAIQELLASEEYIGAKIEDVRVLKAAPPQSNQENLEASRWVNVEFHVDVGDRVSFGFRGNTVFSKGYLNALIDEQRVIGLGKDYVTVIKNRLEEEYKSAGYAKVEITPYTVEGSAKEGRRVTYFIKEGPLVRIQSVEFDGNFVFSSAQLEEEFFAKSSSLVKNKVYIEKEVQKGAELLVEWMKENGYLSSKLITITSYYLPKPRTQVANSSIKLMIYLYEGNQTLVQNISISGLTVFTPDEVKKILNLQAEKPLNLFAFGEGIEILKRAYRNKGYLNFRILNEGTAGLIEYKQENHLANISLQIEEGTQYRVSHVDIEGLEKTQEHVVRRQLPFQEGQILSEALLVESERRLRRLGIFSTVVIRPVDDPNQPGSKIVKVSVHEADRGILTWGPGLRNDLGVRLFGQLAYTSLWGLDHTALINVSTNRRFYLYHFAEAQGQIAYIWPWFGVPDLTFRPAISGGRTQYINFAADTLTVASNWEKVLLTSPNLTGSFAYTLETIRQFQAIEAINNGQLLIGSITPRLTLDRRDNPLTPSKGFYSTVWFDFAAPYLGARSDISYYRAQFRADYHLPLIPDVRWYFSFRTGYEKNIAPPDAATGPQGTSIPLIRQFALGGIGSLRGYQEQELNYQDMTIRGSLSYVNYRTQLDLPFAGALKFGLFADAANLLRDNYSFGGLRYGTGFGFHYQTPVGPVNFDWAFKLNPPPKADAYVIHFSVGII